VGATPEPRVAPRVLIIRYPHEAILGANPAAIPGYPVKLFPLFGRAVLVRQELDSGRVIAFREDRDAVIGSAPRGWNGSQEGGAASFEQRYWARQSTRQVGGVTVRYLGSRSWRIPYDLLDRLEPIP